MCVCEWARCVCVCTRCVCVSARARMRVCVCARVRAVCVCVYMCVCLHNAFFKLISAHPHRRLYSYSSRNPVRRHTGTPQDSCHTGHSAVSTPRQRRQFDTRQCPSHTCRLSTRTCTGTPLLGRTCLTPVHTRTPRNSRYRRFPSRRLKDQKPTWKRMLNNNDDGNS